MSMNELISYVALTGGLIAIVQGGFSIYESARKHDLLPINPIKTLRFLSFLSTVLAFVYLFTYSAYPHAIVFFLISWTIDSYFFGTKVERPSRYEIWMMIYQTNVLFMLIILYLITRILNVLQKIVT